MLLFYFEEKLIFLLLKLEHQNLLFSARIQSRTNPGTYDLYFPNRDNMLADTDLLNTFAKGNKNNKRGRARIRPRVCRACDIINRRYMRRISLIYARNCSARGYNTTQHDSIAADEKSRINSSLFITLETLAVIRHLFFILSSLAATTAAVASY